MIMLRPSLDEWRRLYQAASAFKEAAPWEWMSEADVFGIQDPESGQLGYASVMGMAGEHFALAVYLGSEGLEGFWRIHREGIRELESLLEVPQLQASWEDRQELRREDLEVIKALGLKFRGRKAWPMFRSYVPGFLPWFLTAEEARFLTFALEQALDVALRVRESPDLLNPLREGIYLVRVPTQQGEVLTWRDEWLTPPPPQTPPPPTIPKADVAAARHLPRRNILLEVELFAMPAPVREKEDPRPYFLYNLMAVEARSGYIVGTKLLTPKPSLDAMWARVPEVFLQMLHHLNGLPAGVAVSRQRLYEFLKPTATALGIPLTKTRRLRALEQARKALEAWIL